MKTLIHIQERRSCSSNSQFLVSETRRPACTLAIIRVRIPLPPPVPSSGSLLRPGGPIPRRSMCPASCAATIFVLANGGACSPKAGDASAREHPKEESCETS